MSIYRQPYNVEVHDGTDLNDFYGRLRYAAATKLQTWYEIQEAEGLHYIAIGDLRIFIADHESTSVYQCQSDFSVINRDVEDTEERRIIGTINYPRFCKKTVIAKHLDLTVPQLKNLLGGYGYEHVIADQMYPGNYTQMVIVKTALLSADRAGLTKRIPVRQESINIEY